MKANKLTRQFPNIFRTIPESKLLKKALKSKSLFYLICGFAVAISLLLVLGIGIAGLSLYRNTGLFVQVINQRQEIQNKINFWQSIADKYEGYKDAYFQIAVLQYKLGDMEKAKQADNRALLLDPDFEDAKRLAVLLNK